MKRSRAPLTLMEQLVMLAVFALAAAICLQTFVKADRLSRRGEAADHAAVLCQTAAASVQRAGGLEAGLEMRQVSWWGGPALTPEEGGWRICYDADWVPIAGPSVTGQLPVPETAYRLIATPLKSDVPGLGRAALTVETAGGDLLFQLETAWQEVTEDG